MAAWKGIAVVLVLLNLWFLYISYVPGAHLEPPQLQISYVFSNSSDVSNNNGFNKNVENSSVPDVRNNNGLKGDLENSSPPDAPINNGTNEDLLNSSPPDVPNNNGLNENLGNSSPPEACDYSKGKWIPDSTPPLYTSETCKFIQPNQNCVKNGRPDRDYLNWRWKPDECELPFLDPAAFLSLMRNKKMIFIGDSMARNHMQSLLCALAQVEEPHKLEKPEIIFFEETEKEMRWGFDIHNFTLTHIWSPFLVQHSVEEDVYHVYLDVPDKIWSSKVHDYDIAIISTGYWYYRPSIYYTNNTVIGCNPCKGINLTATLDQVTAYRISHGNILNYMVKEFKGHTILRTVTVDHFEHGAWYNGGVCNRTQPFSPSRSLPFMSKEMNRIQVEEFNKVSSSSSKMGILNITYSAYMRPDGHPNFFKVQVPGKRPVNDCLHWCLPGPVDMWNQLISEVIKKF